MGEEAQMENEIFPKHYESWKKCITQKCKTPLTKEFVKERIKVLSQKDSKGRKDFVEKYGDHWTDRVLGYFKQALEEV